MQQLVIYW